MLRTTLERVFFFFYSSRIYSYNALLFGILEKYISNLQIIQNAAQVLERAK